MPAQKIEFMYEIPDGYRFVGYRKANEGECYLRYGKVLIAQSENGSEWPIVERVLGREGPAENSKRRKHADLIHAWAEGAIIQVEVGCTSLTQWVDCPNNDPSWKPDRIYRIKPAKRTIKFRNWLMKSGDIVTHQEGRTPDPTESKNFVGWVCGWQEVEVDK